ncbi:MAG: aconitate hydratase AcnA [candidate division KSB1 bacterium]|nr:aconitate hydratase AcnA [candidate division KSB1 bacterium]
MVTNTFNTLKTLDSPVGSRKIYKLEQLEKENVTNVSALPYSIKILLESVLRNCDDHTITRDDVINLAKWRADRPSGNEVPFKPARVLLQDFTGVPSVVDLAAMRSAMQRLGGDPREIEPMIPCDLVIDHSVQTDFYGRPDALTKNMQMEFERNRERYKFLKWGQQAFNKLRVIPPGVGIIHQVNLEYLARGVFETKDKIVYPDTLVGTDSHTVMINGLGIVGWGVGGIEAEAVMLGQPLYMLAPEVVGFKLTGKLGQGVTATDLALTVVQKLRETGVVGKFVEFFGDGVDHMSLPDRATIANMGPEYGATMGFFPMDAESLHYLRRTGRSEEQVQLVEWYMKEQGLFRGEESTVPEYSQVVTLNLSEVEASLAGPKRPQDRISLQRIKSSFSESLRAPRKARGFEVADTAASKQVTIDMDGEAYTLQHGFVAIASITSCTNTSNPSVMLAAGLLARKAVQVGLKVPQYVKTSLAPGSRVVTQYLDRTGLTPFLDELGFQTVGYGCASCIGNSGPLPAPVSEAIEENDLVAAAVLSGNRNFEGRVNPLTQANYLASPPLVVAFALAGRVDVDLKHEPIGTGRDGQDIYLKDIWPDHKQVLELLQSSADPALFRKVYEKIDEQSPEWESIAATDEPIYNWQPDSTYIQEPPFFMQLKKGSGLASIENARVLALLGDSVTTDHISPAGAIPKNSPAAEYLSRHGVDRNDFNSFGSRRGNDRVMVRGTFGNIRLDNLLVPDTQGGYTVHFPDGEKMSIFDAAMKYKEEQVPLIVLAGKEYGTGSSRDWAAKGTLLLGVKAVIAESYERIHRSNLVGMGVLPLQFNAGESAESLGLDGSEVYSLSLDEQLKPAQPVSVKAVSANGKATLFTVTNRLDAPIEIEYYRNGGILHTVLRNKTGL